MEKLLAKGTVFGQIMHGTKKFMVNRYHDWFTWSTKNWKGE